MLRSPGSILPTNPVVMIFTSAPMSNKVRQVCAFPFTINSPVPRRTCSMRELMYLGGSSTWMSCFEASPDRSALRVTAGCLVASVSVLFLCVVVWTWCAWMMLSATPFS